jgi:hypothetical protein
MSTTHELKTWPQYFQCLLSGQKTFEVRKDDRGYQSGDLLVLCEFDPNDCKHHLTECTLTCQAYSGREMRFRIGFIYRHAPDWLDCGEYVVMSLLPLNIDGAAAMTDVADLRVWRAGDPEPPPDVTLLHNRWRASFQMAYLRRVGSGWWWVTSPHETPPAGHPQLGVAGTEPHRRTR